MTCHLRRGLLAGAAVLLACLCAATSAFASAPANDNFANAQTITGTKANITASNVDATGEPGEPSEYGVSSPASIWYSWTPATSGTAVFTTCGSAIATQLGVYTGTAVNALTSVGSSIGSFDGCGTYDGTSAIVFQAVANTTYHIGLYGENNATGSVQLHLNPAPPNDNFAGALAVAGGFTIPSYNVSATIEAGEPNHANNSGGHSAWWTWVAPVSAPVTISTCGSSFDTLLGVYTGTSVSGLTAVASSDDSNACGTGSTQSSVSFVATAGTRYAIAVDGKNGAVGSVALNIPPANDDLAGALPVVNSTYGVLQNATAEAGEPAHGGVAASHSVWYQWTAPFTGTARIDTCIAAFDTTLSVYTGSTIGSLTQVADNDDSDTCGTGSTRSSVTFQAVSGTVYDIAVDSKTGATGDFTLAIPPANDNFADAITINGSPAEARGQNDLATKETGEPNHGGDPGGASVWYVWTAPADPTSVTISSCGSTFDTLLGVYTGTAVGALTAVGESDDSDFCGTGSKQSAVTFTPTANTTYRIAVDGHGGATGQVKVNVGAPANDGFDNAQTIPAAGGSPSGSTVGASLETGEPLHANTTDSRSVWYAWTAPKNESVSVDTCGANFNTVLGVYTGTAVNALTAVASNDDSSFCASGSRQSRVAFQATAGTTYEIAVAAAFDAPGSFTLHLTAGVPASFYIYLPGPATAGTPISIAVSARDAQGNTLTSYNRSGVTLTDKLAGLPAGTVLQPFVNGVSRGNTVTFPAPLHNDVLTVADGTVSTNKTISVYGPLTRYVFVLPQLLSAGGTNDITVEAKDAADNTLTKVNGAAATWHDASGTISNGTPLNAFVDGVSRNNRLPVDHAVHADTITVTGGSVTSTGNYNVYGPLAKFSIGFASAPVVGTPASVTVDAEDSAGNVLTTVTGAIASWQDSRGTITPGTPLAGFVKGVSRSNTFTPTHSGSDTITVTSGSVTSTHVTTVKAAS